MQVTDWMTKDLGVKDRYEIISVPLSSVLEEVEGLASYTSEALWHAVVGVLFSAT